jgi:PAS domain S-box-containing protein
VTSAGDRRHMSRTARAALRRAQRVVTRLGAVHLQPGAAIAAGLAVGCGAILLKGAFNALLGGETGFILLLGAVAVASWIGGMAGGLTATLVAAVLNAVFFVGGSGPSFALSQIDSARMILYTVSGAVVSFLISSLQSSRDRVASSLRDAGAMASDIERRDERLELVLAASGTGFWEWDVRTGSLTWSEAIFQQHGIAPGPTAPSYERYIATIHPDDRATFAGVIDDVLVSGTTFSREFRILWPDGSVHWTHGVGRVFRDAAGQPLRLVGTGTDITQRRRIEEERDGLLNEERRAGAFREAFLGVISHELRTPITTVLGLTQILARKGRNTNPEEQAALIADVAAEAERLHRLVEDLLVLTKAERGEFVVEAEPIELRRLVSRVVARESTNLPGLAITTDLPPDLPVAAGEETYVEQVVRNMLGNAAKYTPPGTAVVVRASLEDDEVVVRVLDSGPGIEMETESRAFELFYRDPTSARRIAGSGIGLFVCASLVEAMGGRIWARRRPEGGSEFGFTLRVLSDDDGPSVPISPEAPLGSSVLPRG